MSIFWLLLLYYNSNNYYSSIIIIFIFNIIIIIINSSSIVIIISNVIAITIRNNIILELAGIPAVYALEASYKSFRFPPYSRCSF